LPITQSNDDISDKQSTVKVKDVRVEPDDLIRVIDPYSKAKDMFVDVDPELWNASWDRFGGIQLRQRWLI
jgi:hypothetical protein